MDILNHVNGNVNKVIVLVSHLMEKDGGQKTVKCTRVVCIP